MQGKKRVFAYLVTTLVVLIVVAVNVFHRNIVQLHTSQNKKWIALNGWLVDAVSDSSTSLPLQYAFIGVNQPSLSTATGDIYGPGIDTQNSTLTASNDSLYMVYDLRMMASTKQNVENGPLNIQISTPYWNKTFKFGTANVHLLNGDVHWLDETLSNAGTQGEFTKTHVMIKTLKNVTNEPVYIKSMVQSGDIDVTRLGFLNGTFMPDQVNVNQLKSIGNQGIKVNPGQSVTLYEQMSFNSPSPYRNVFFQPAINVVQNGTEGVQILSPMEWTELFTPNLLNNLPTPYVSFK